jgi:hypothetical protein
MSGRGNEASPGRKWAPTMAIDGGMSGERKRRGPGGRGSCGVAMAGGGGGGSDGPPPPPERLQKIER